jgi:NADPH-dependent glutamate synthase beta subunit-like oxidoreductase
MEQKELRRLEDRCIQEYAPPCTAACPIHVDVRGMMSEISRRDLEAALKTVRKKLPFPGVIGRICEQPCRTVCNRKNAGGSLAVAALERACTEMGTHQPEKKPAMPWKNKKVAVVGGGLSGLTATLDLVKKGYPVVLFEARDQLGGRLWDVPKEILPRSVLKAELDVMAQGGVDLRLNMRVGERLSLADLRREFGAIYLSLEVGSNKADGLELGNGGRAQIDPVTLETSEPGVFAKPLREGPYSPILAMSDARRAAVSIDRYVQKVSMTAARLNEGSYVTRLYTNTAGIAPLGMVPMAEPQVGYSLDEAEQEARRCIQCQCLECVKVCRYLEHYGSYPKKYVREVYNNLSIVMGHRQANQFINSCSLCSLCREVCPEDLDMGAVCRQARRTMVEQGRMPPSAHEFALRDMQFSNSEAFTLARHQPGAVGSEYVFFPGCQLSASAPEQVERVYAHLREVLGVPVGLMLRCCGAPAEWAGRMDLFRSALAEFQAAHQTLGKPRLILACSTCYQMFQTYLPEVEMVSLWVLFEQRGLPARATPLDNKGVVSIHDPCTTRGEQSIQDSVRRILDQLGYNVEELPLSRDKTECCSYGGLMWLANRSLAKAVVQRRIMEGSTDYVTYCAMCRDLFAAQGKRSLYLLDLLFEADPESRAIRASPGYSQRRENRAWLKRKLIKEVWGEEMPGSKDYEKITLDIPPEVQSRMEERLILVEDIKQVIAHAENTGKKLINSQTGHFLAHHRPGNVTYWVEYSPVPKSHGFAIHNAYSHRMLIEESKKL